MKRIAFLLVACAACVSTLFASGTGKGKVLTLIKESDLNSMDPQIASDGLALEVIATTVEGLYTTAANGSAQPALAKKAEVSKDGPEVHLHPAGRQVEQWRAGHCQGLRLWLAAAGEPQAGERLCLHDGHRWREEC